MDLPIWGAMFAGHGGDRTTRTGFRYERRVIEMLHQRQFGYQRGSANCGLAQADYCLSPPSGACEVQVARQPLGIASLLGQKLSNVESLHALCGDNQIYGSIQDPFINRIAA